MKVMKAVPIVGKVKEDIDRVFDRFFTTPFFGESLLPPFETPMSDDGLGAAFDLSRRKRGSPSGWKCPGSTRRTWTST